MVIWAGPSTAKLGLTHKAAGRGFESSHVGSRIGLLMTELLASPRATMRKREREGQREPAGSFVNLIMKWTYHHFCHSPVVAQTNRVLCGRGYSSRREGWGHQEAGVTHPGGWLPRSPR